MNAPERPPNPPGCIVVLNEEIERARRQTPAERIAAKVRTKLQANRALQIAAQARAIRATVGRAHVGTPHGR